MRLSVRLGDGIQHCLPQVVEFTNEAHAVFGFCNIHGTAGGLLFGDLMVISVMFGTHMSHRSYAVALIMAEIASFPQDVTGNGL